MEDKSNDEIEKELKTEVNSVEYFIEISPKTGDYTLALKKDGKKQYVLSKYKPREHAIQQLGNNWGNKSTIWILIGYGFGYMTEAIIDKVGKDTVIIIIEPDQKLLEEQRTLFQIKKELKNTYIIKTLNPIKLNESLRELIPLTEMYNINIRYIDGYLEYYKLVCHMIFDEINNLKNSLKIDFGTLLTRQRDNYLNCLKNARYISENHDIFHLQEICKDIPALIVCAGPSLDNNINEIKNFKGIIIAIGRTLSPLLNLGIRPDFIFNLDPTDLIYATFGDYKKHNIPLVTTIDANSKVVENSYAEKYLLYDSPIITHIFKTHVNPHTAYSQSVSSLCLSFAEFLKCNPIIIVGQDLAYTENKLYTGSSIRVNRQDPHEKIIKGFYNQPVRSTESWISLIKWIEAQILKYPHILHINATEGGAYIEGMLHMPLKEAIKKYCIKEKPEITHIKLNRSKAINYEKCMKEAKNSFIKLHRLSKIIVNYYKQLEYEKDNSKIQKINDDINKIIKNINYIPNSKNLVDLLLENINIMIKIDNENKEQIDEEEEEKNIRRIRILKEKYRHLAEACEEFIELIDIAMEDYQRSSKV